MEVNRPRTDLRRTLAHGVEALDGDVVEIAGAMHGRARCRFGDDQQLGAAGVGFDFRQQRGKTRRDFLAFDRTQNAQARSGHDLQRVLAVDFHQFVAAVAEEGKVVLREPGEKGLAFGQLVQRQGWRVRRDLAENGRHPRASSANLRPPRERREHARMSAANCPSPR